MNGQTERQEGWMTAEQVAGHIGSGINRTRRLMRTGLIKSRVDGRQLKAHRTDVDRYMRSLPLASAVVVPEKAARRSPRRRGKVDQFA